MPESRDTSLRQRLIVIDIMVPVIILVNLIGGWLFFVFLTAALLIAGWELWRLFKHSGYSPSLAVILGSILVIAASRWLWGFENSSLIVSAILLVSMAVHLVEQQHGSETAALDFMTTVTSSLYIGWIGSYALSIRLLPDGLYWVFLVFPAVALADTGGYLFGRQFGKHRIADRVSPKKTWEGFVGGIIMGTLGAWGLAALWNLITPGITPMDGILVGLVMSILTPLGDFGESMIKRQFNAKDASHLLPGHGGVFDRIDSSLWAAVIGYALILFLK
jgi:phosphatidate cytidylyltransferase